MSRSKQYLSAKLRLVGFSFTLAHLIDLTLVVLLIVGGYYLLEWKEVHDQTIAESSVQNIRPDDGQVTSADIANINNRLKCSINTRSTNFRVIQIKGGGNDYESYQNLKSCYVESDFMATYDGTIISAHDNTDIGSCGLISQSKWADLRDCENNNGNKISTLRDFLRLPLSEWFIDLKTTTSEDDVYITAVIKQAVEDIKLTGRQNGAVLMIYNAPPGAIKIIKDNNIRVGLKGYPRSSEGVRVMVDKASEKEFEMVCVSAHLLNEEIIAYSNNVNVWLLPWTAARPNLEQWQNMVDWGSGGLITAWVGWSEVNLKY